jgi:PPK2 family polyphosphate:nucleotide phosphotransferase
VDWETELRKWVVPPNGRSSLKQDFDPAYRPKSLRKRDAENLLRENLLQMEELQDRLYAQNTQALLILFQAMDAAGKDGTIKHVMSGLNPQGCEVHSFKAPSAEELDHDYLWRCAKALPEKGRIGIFNRSYYEEVLVVRVHPEYLERQNLPPAATRGNLWRRRYEEINRFEEYLRANGIYVLKFFLHLSREEQKKRFLERIERPGKNWKFSMADVRERRFWDDYMNAYEEMIRRTSTAWAPWHVIPADHKWYAHLAVGRTICLRLRAMDPRYPAAGEEKRRELLQAKAALAKEK